MNLRTYQKCLLLALNLTVAQSADSASVTAPSEKPTQPTTVSPPTGGTTTPKLTLPGDTKIPSGGSKITYVGPTANITELANHIQVQAKSLTSLVTVASGLALTNPVTISVAYLSPSP